jgi:uncharacterized protein
MSTERNKRLALELIQAAIDSRKEDILQLTTADATWWISGSTPLSGTYPVKTLFAHSGALFTGLKKPFTGGVGAVTAEADRVSLESWGHAEFEDGRVYHNEVHLLLLFRGDKISAVREYGDTALLQALFCKDAPAGADARPGEQDRPQP